jgi:hypothetical protein
MIENVSHHDIVSRAQDSLFDDMSAFKIVHIITIIELRINEDYENL